MANVLIIDDDEGLCYSVERALRNIHKVFTATHSDSAYNILSNNPIDIAFIDQRLGKENGTEVLKEIKGRFPKLPCILMTAYGSSETILESISRGAADFISKPLETQDFLNLIEANLIQKNLCSDDYVNISDLSYSEDIFIGKSPEMIKILKTVATVAATDSPVLITGESGTGKDHIAKIIHNYSKRAKYPFVPINSAAIPRNLLESEMFGHVKGAFSGAYQSKKGKFEVADKGTIFLNEIGDLPAGLQAKLLHVLQDGSFEKLGENKLKKVDVRLISATNKDLNEKLEFGSFREDLFYRLNVFSIHLPPLRKRKADIVELAKFFIKEACENLDKEITCVHKDVFDMLTSYDWPGNIRELKNIVNKSVIVSNRQSLEPDDVILPDSRTEIEVGEDIKKDLYDNYKEHFYGDALHSVLEDIEKEFIEDALKDCHGNVSKVSELLGVSRVTLYDKIKKYSIKI